MNTEQILHLYRLGLISNEYLLKELGFKLSDIPELFKPSPGMRARRMAEPLVEIEDYTDEAFWPEWKIESSPGGEHRIVKAPDEKMAKRIFDNERKIK